MKTANIITLARIALVPVFFVLWYVAPWYATLAVFIIAGITDKIDGYIARKYNQITTFGKFLDPLADKLLVCSALVLLTSEGRAAAWAVTVIISRELIITAFRTVAMSQGRVLAADWSGKIKTVIQIVAICIMLCPPVADIAFGGVTFGEIGLWLTVAATVYSGADYLIRNADVLDLKNK